MKTIYWNIIHTEYGCDIYGNIYCRKIPRYNTKKSIREEFNLFGYWTVWQWFNTGHYKQCGVYKNCLSHRFIYETINRCCIMPNIHVNHIDEDKTNNSINNLELLTHQENQNHGTKNERCWKTKVENSTYEKYETFATTRSVFKSFCNHKDRNLNLDDFEEVFSHNVLKNDGKNRRMYFFIKKR